MTILKVDKTLDTDVLVIGGGLAGCWAALRARQAGARTLLVDKGYISRAGCSPMSGGVMTAPTADDDLDVWAGEVVERGGYMNNQEHLEAFLPDMMAIVQEIDAMGPVIIRDREGKIRRLASRGMMNVRCLQFNPKETMTLMRRRVESVGCEVMDRVHILELLRDQDGAVSGALGLFVRSGEICRIHAGAVVIASGPLNIKGRNMADNVGADGHALAWRVGAELSDMEFAFGGTFSLMQRQYKFPAYNIALGHGAQLINAQGERFMERYDPERMERGELPQVIAAFLNENLCGRGPVYIDLRHADNHLVDDLRAVRGSIWADELTTGRIKDYRERPILIEPQWTVWSHRAGIRIGLDCSATADGLYAAGSVVKIEAVGTHASAGVPVGFACVSGARAGASAAAFAKGRGAPAGSMADQVEPVLARLAAASAATGGATPNSIYRTLRETLGTPLDCMVLSAERIAQIRARLDGLHEELGEAGAADPHEMVKLEEARNFVEAFGVTMASAAERTESRESFFRRDYPDTDNINWFCWHVARLDAAGPVLRRVPVPLETYKRKPLNLPARHLSTIGHNLQEALNGQRIA